MNNRLRWFRFYTEALDDEKVQLLPPSLFKTWINLLCLAASSGGKIPRASSVSFRLRLSTHDTQQQIDELILAGLIDIGPDGALKPHNWEVRQYVSDTSSDRVRKFRKNNKKRRRNGDETFHGTTPEAETETEAETEADSKQNKKTAHFPSLRAQPSTQKK